MTKSYFRAAFSAFMCALIAVSALTPALALQPFGRDGGRQTGSNEIVEIPQSEMTVTANSYNPGYPPGNVLDGRTDSIWHSEWVPENDPFPPYSDHRPVSKKPFERHIHFSPAGRPGRPDQKGSDLRRRRSGKYGACD